MNKVLNVKCPHCGTKFSYYESKFRPFCSERCRMVDLGHWLEESYRIPEKPKNPNEISPEMLDGQMTGEFDHIEENEEEGFSYDNQEFEIEDDENGHH